LASGGRYSTSKLQDRDSEGADKALQGVETYGFRGEALASMADIATLEIRTRAKGQDGTSELVMREGEVLSCGESNVQRSGHGTTVWVRDIFWKVRSFSSSPFSLSQLTSRDTAVPSAPPTLLQALRPVNPPHLPPHQPFSTRPHPSLCLVLPRRHYLFLFRYLCRGEDAPPALESERRVAGTVETALWEGGNGEDLGV
jgi:hypothetical protein